MASESMIEIAMETLRQCGVSSEARDTASGNGVRYVATLELLRGRMTWPCCLRGRLDAKREMKHRCAVWSIC